MGLESLAAGLPTERRLRLLRDSRSQFSPSPTGTHAPASASSWARSGENCEGTAASAGAGRAAEPPIMPAVAKNRAMLVRWELECSGIDQAEEAKTPHFKIDTLRWSCHRSPKRSREHDRVANITLPTSAAGWYGSDREGRAHPNGHGWPPGLCRLSPVQTAAHAALESAPHSAPTQPPHSGSPR